MNALHSRWMGRTMLGLAAAATIAVGCANAAQAANTYAYAINADHVTSFDIVATAQETQDLMHGGYGAFSTGDWICSRGPMTTTSNYGFVINEVACGDALTNCAKALDDGQHQGQLAAVTWRPDFPAMAYGHYQCVTYLTGQAAADLFVLASQIPPGHGG